MLFLIKVLLIEDEDDHAELILRSFDNLKESFSLLRVSTIQEAKDSLFDFMPDVVITDWKLPDGLGIDLLREDNQFPIIIITSQGSQNIAVQAMKKGAMDYIVKSPENFVTIPNTVLKTYNQWLNILEKKYAEEQLIKSEERYRTLVETINDAIFILDLSGVFVFISPVIEKITNYSVSDIIGKHFIEFIYNHDKKKLGNEFDMILKGHSFDDELRIIDKNEEVLYFQVKSKILKQTNIIIGVTGVLTNITDRKKIEDEKQKLQKQLLQSQKLEAIGTLAGGIAHDFNNILSAIIGYTELSMQIVEYNSQIHNNLENIKKSSLRAIDLIKQILTFSRQNEDETKPTQIQFVVQDTLKMLRGTIPVTIEIKTEIDEFLPPINVNATHIYQIVTNLCTNAYQAIKNKNGFIEVNLNKIILKRDSVPKWIDLKEGEYLNLIVKDNGTGIPPEIIDRIFDPFFTTKSNNSGTGLGLSTTHGIIKKYNGKIIVESEVGKGTEFSIYFPVEKNIEISTKEITENKEKKMSGNILFIDDEEILVTITKLNLEKYGFNVFSFSNSLNAFDFFYKNQNLIDVIITDLTMPNLTGIELINKVRLINQKVSIILCSGYNDNINSEILERLNFSYIDKPFLFNELIDLITKISKK